MLGGALHFCLSRFSIASCMSMQSRFFSDLLCFARLLPKFTPVLESANVHSFEPYDFPFRRSGGSVICACLPTNRPKGLLAYLRLQCFHFDHLINASSTMMMMSFISQ